MGETFSYIATLAHILYVDTVLFYLSTFDKDLTLEDKTTGENVTQSFTMCSVVLTIV
jgi:hypothetical protein